MPHAHSTNPIGISRLPAEVADRLAKICGLLGSNHDGERSAAAWHASQILFEHKLTWQDLVVSAGARNHAPAALGWQEKVHRCRAVYWVFSQWEWDFLANLMTYHRQPTEKQLQILDRLHAKAGMP